VSFFLPIYSAKITRRRWRWQQRNCNTRSNTGGEYVEKADIYSLQVHARSFALRPTTGSGGIFCDLGQSDRRYMNNRYRSYSVASFSTSSIFNSLTIGEWCVRDIAIDVGRSTIMCLTHTTRILYALDFFRRLHISCGRQKYAQSVQKRTFNIYIAYRVKLSSLHFVYSDIIWVMLLLLHSAFHVVLNFQFMTWFFEDGWILCLCLHVPLQSG